MAHKTSQYYNQVFMQYEVYKVIFYPIDYILRYKSLTQITEIQL